VRPAGPTTSSTPSGPNMSTLSGPVAGWHTEPAVLGSFTLNAVLFVLVLALTCLHFKRKGCCCCSVKDSAEYSLDQQEMQNPQYQKIQLPPTQFLSECIYSKAQLSVFMPRH
ncbi:hypothetical protein GOODEAATRI_013308, partial [Goodea atripinnis]